jgi:hypothetical protein
MDKQVLTLRGQANKAAHKAGRLRKLAQRWVEDVWAHEELRIGGCIPADPVAARQHKDYMKTRPVDRYDVSPSDSGYMMIGGRVWAEIERLLVGYIFADAAFYDGPHGPGERVRRLQEIADAAVADGTAMVLDEDGQVPDVPSLSGAGVGEDC